MNVINKKMLFLMRIAFLPLGFLYKVIRISIAGARDIHNKFRFPKTRIDDECIICTKSKIAYYCHILENCVILNSKINSYTYTGKNTIIQNSTIGSYCSIANDVLIGLGSHPIEHFSTATLFYKKKNTLNIELVDKDLEFAEYKPIEIGNDVWIGARAIILDGIKIGHGSIIAANSVVTKDVPPYAIVGGVPAKIIRYRFSEDKIEKLLKSKWWHAKLEEIKLQISELNNF